MTAGGFPAGRPGRDATHLLIEWAAGIETRPRERARAGVVLVLEFN